MAADLASDLELLAQAAETGESEEADRLRAKLPWLKDNLGKLADYFQKTRKDAESFIRNPEALAAALKALAHREKTVQALISALE